MALNRVDYVWSWYRVPDYLAYQDEAGVWKAGLLAKGLLLTLEISVVSTVMAIIIGLFTGLAPHLQDALPALGRGGLHRAHPGHPLLVQIFIFYFFVADVFGLSRFAAGASALAIFAGAYVAEIVRAGIQSIDRGQMEAARSLGMNYRQGHALHRPAPGPAEDPAAPGRQFISLIKDSSLVSAIALTDLAKAGRELVTVSFAAFEVWFTVPGLYLVLTFSLSMIIQWMERRYGVGER